jgi:phosphatidylserine decarboxylase
VRVAPEGLPFIAGGLGILALLLALAAWLGGWWLWPALGWLPVALWVPWFFRDPDRSGPRGDHILVAPADGKVVSVVEVEEPDFLRGPATRVSVFMNVFSVHVNRHPVDGTVEYRNYRAGQFVNATLEKASEDNEQMSIGIQSRSGALMVRQIAGLVARRIVTDAQVGDAVRQGERLGLIRFGSRVDTFVPPGTRVMVQPGDHTTAGTTVLAEWAS